MKSLIITILTLITISSTGSTQSYIEPIVGSRFALNNKTYKFFQINIGAQYSVRKNRNYDILLQSIISWPIAKSSTVQAYTTNPLLPVSVNIDKAIKPYTLSFALGHRLTLFGGEQNNYLALLIYTGVVYEQILVSYAYDKQNYIILNPDKTQNRASIFASGGFEYLHKLSKGRLFAHLVIASPPFGGSIKYPSTFGFITALSLNVGYAIPLTKIKTTQNH